MTQANNKNCHYSDQATCINKCIAYPWAHLSLSQMCISRQKLPFRVLQKMAESVTIALFAHYITTHTPSHGNCAAVNLINAGPCVWRCRAKNRNAEILKVAFNRRGSSSLVLHSFSNQRRSGPLSHFFIHDCCTHSSGTHDNVASLDSLNTQCASH